MTPNITPPGVSPWSAQARLILDAGGDTSAMLRGSLYRCMATIDSNQILEVISPEESTRLEIARWCRLSGNTVLQVQENEFGSTFWIRKTGRDSVNVRAEDRVDGIRTVLPLHIVPATGGSSPPENDE